MAIEYNTDTDNQIVTLMNHKGVIDDPTERECELGWIVEDIAQYEGIRQRISLCFTSRIPFLAGVFQNKIIWTDPRLYDLDENIFRFIMAHEIGHLKHRLPLLIENPSTAPLLLTFATLAPQIIAGYGLACSTGNISYANWALEKVNFSDAPYAIFNEPANWVRDKLLREIELKCDEVGERHGGVEGMEKYADFMKRQGHVADCSQYYSLEDRIEYLRTKDDRSRMSWQERVGEKIARMRQ